MCEKGLNTSEISPLSNTSEESFNFRNFLFPIISVLHVHGYTKPESEEFVIADEYDLRKILVSM